MGGGGLPAYTGTPDCSTTYHRPAREADCQARVTLILMLGEVAAARSVAAGTERRKV